MMDEVYLIDTGYACAGISVKNGKVVETSPIFHWMLGKSLDTIMRWKRIKNIKKLEEIENDG